MSLAAVQVFSLSSYLLVYPSNLFLGGFSIASYIALGQLVQARNNIAQMYLQKDGETLEIYVYTAGGKINPNPKQFLISEIEVPPDDEVRFETDNIAWKDRKMYLNLEIGVVHEPELFQAIKLGHTIDTQLFVNDDI